MSEVVIKVENLSKKYTIRHQQRESYTAMRDVMANGAKSLGAKLLSPFTFHPSRSLPSAPCSQPSALSPSREDFWALKDVSFEVKRGEVIGIIGRNGAGKSTLLKILSRITEPTTGSVKIKGRVASLLEVGTGFHPELTGRENIYLNGAILGMTKAEIKKKFDEIVAFAEIEKFLDTPVKRYSSGMYVRLAFAVAAHLEPEILLVDEVLAVGDVQFQKKCLGKMGEVAKGGRTVLFVSHNMGAIKQLCSNAVLLANGKVLLSGDVSEVTESYISNIVNIRADGAEKKFAEDSKKEFQILSVRLLDKAGNISQKFECDVPILLELKCVSRVAVPALYGYLSIDNRSGTNIWISDTYDISPNCLDSLKPGVYTINIRIPPRTIGHGEYLASVAFQSSLGVNSFYIDNPGYVCSFSVSDSRTERGNHRLGYLSTLLKWEIM